MLGGFNNIIGTIESEDAERFRRMIFRITKGNAWTDFKEMDLGLHALVDPLTVILFIYLREK